MASSKPSKQFDRAHIRIWYFLLPGLKCILKMDISSGFPCLFLQKKEKYG